MTRTNEVPDEAPDTLSEKRSGTIQSVAIAARFLNVLASAESELALGEVARRTQTGASTAHRYLQSLVKEGLAKQDPASSLYDLGPAALSIGIGALKRVDAVEIAAQHMKALAHQYAASGGVAIWTDRGPTLVRWYRSAFFSINPLALGDILPIDLPKSVPVCVEQVPVFTGEFGISNGNNAVKITAKHPPGSHHKHTTPPRHALTPVAFQDATP